MTASGVKPFVSAPIALPHEEDESLSSEAGRLEVGGGGVGFEPPLSMRRADVGRTAVQLLDMNSEIRTRIRREILRLGGK